MNMGVSTARSQLCLKRLLDEPSDSLPKCKHARLAPPPPTAGLSPCLRPRSHAPKSNQSQSPSRVGQYFLLERWEGEETYRAEHAHTKQQYTCQVELPVLLILLLLILLLIVIVILLMILQNTHPQTI